MCSTNISALVVLRTSFAKFISASLNHCWHKSMIPSSTLRSLVDCSSLVAVAIQAAFESVSSLSSPFKIEIIGCEAHEFVHRNLRDLWVPRTISPSSNCEASSQVLIIFWAWRLNSFNSLFSKSLITCFRAWKSRDMRLVTETKTKL